MQTPVPDFTTRLRQKQSRAIASAILIILASVYLFTYPPANHLKTIYRQLESPVVKDRNGKIIELKPNAKGYYAKKNEDVPEKFKDLLLKKEDRFFYYHPGMNPFSLLRDIASFLTAGKLRGSSTISQQLVKILLGNENRRSLKNKIIESIYALSLELHASKKEILRMYINSAYFGNQAQGLGEASLFYFAKDPESLTDQEILELLATLNYPSGRYPGSLQNKKILPYLAGVLGINFDKKSSGTERAKNTANPRKDTASFEINALGIDCAAYCELTIDSTLTETIREILAWNLNLASFANVDNGAVVVIKLPENELLSIVGSPDPNSPAEGAQINMALRARPIGSTAKPFIYLNAFAKGARPYSLVEDQEYAYRIGTGFAFYPKNYDGEYRGTVTLHQALSNSLNVPSVKVLEFTGLEEMYDFFRNSLGFKSIQPLENYELGIALGALEMDLLTLAHYFTIFPNEGILKPFKIVLDTPGFLATPMGPEISEEKLVTKKEFAQLINKILSDRETAVDQFGMKSNLTLGSNNYALKTGTSRDFHDSWTIGYTPDFLVGVWLGNSDNTPMQVISGQTGAGKIWHEVMEVLLNSSYNQKAPFHFDSLKEFTESGTIEYGLKGDNYEKIRYIIKDGFRKMILRPHDGDQMLLEKNTVIPLLADETVNWYIDNFFLGAGKETTWQPQQEGYYVIRAENPLTQKEMRILIRISREE